MRLLRVCLLGWLLHFKMQSRAPFDVMSAAVWPLVYATLAYFMFRAGGQPGTLLLASIGATVMGIWSITTVGAADAIQRQRWQGVLELLVAAPTPFWSVLLPITIATSTIGVYSLVSTLVWGRFLFGIPLDLEHPLLFALSIPPTIISIGLLGALPRLAAARLVVPRADVGDARPHRLGVRRIAAAGNRRLRGAQRRVRPLRLAAPRPVPRIRAAARDTVAHMMALT